MTGRLVTKNGKYYVVISYKDEHGKNKQKWAATGLDAKNNKRAAEEAMREIVANFNNEDMATTPIRSQSKTKTSGDSGIILISGLKLQKQIYKSVHTLHTK